MAINHQSIDRVLNHPPPNRGRSTHPAAGWLAGFRSARRAPPLLTRNGRRSPSLTGNPSVVGGLSMRCSFVNAAPPGRGGRAAVPIVLIDRRGRN
jgi:hypothetical protein